TELRLFNKVQKVISGKTWEERPHGKIISHNHFPLRGFLKCPKCGGHITGSGSRGKKMCIIITVILNAVIDKVLI
ncbi:zinc ribbon domain-containing protein, partial [Chryseobacterium sp. FP211-J200]